jgi:hypothetical protein
VVRDAAQQSHSNGPVRRSIALAACWIQTPGGTTYWNENLRPT